MIKDTWLKDPAQGDLVVFPSTDLGLVISQVDDVQFLVLLSPVEAYGNQPYIEAELRVIGTRFLRMNSDLAQCVKTHDPGH